jgi:diaminopimelate epimerase
MNFKKYQGTGNDFIMIDGRDIDFDLTEQQIELLCHRRFGIGADGLIVLKNHPAYDFEMLYHNSDGKVGSMCGNGGRCTVRFAFDLGAIGHQTRFLAADGEHQAEVDGDIVHLKMGELTVFEKYENYDFLNTGSPHYISMTSNLHDFDVYQAGKKIRYADEWVARGGTNVNFTEILENNTLYVRTYERGVEDETYSCGTGVTAAAIASHERFGLESPVKIKTQGGDLSVSFNKNNQNKYEEIYLIGPAKWVFDGKF